MYGKSILDAIPIMLYSSIKTGDVSVWNKWNCWFVRPKKANIEYIYCMLSNVQSHIHQQSQNPTVCIRNSKSISCISHANIKCLFVWSVWGFLWAIICICLRYTHRRGRKKNILINQHIFIRFLTFLFIDLHRSKISSERKSKEGKKRLNMNCIKWNNVTNLAKNPKNCTTTNDWINGFINMDVASLMCVNQK